MHPYQYFPSYRHYYPPPQKFYVPYTPPIRFRPYIRRQQFPTVNPDMFMSSAQHMQTLMKDASLVLGKMANSHQFSLDLMTAAQKSDKEKVTQMLKETGIQTTPDVTYSPDGLKLDFKTVVDQVDCCHLNLSLRWM
ncbi:hypothetical protein ABE096_00575 [Robertmurraya massiliosenegalensis]|uniref:hypothetical protein n=1 Tax=Robertmurraya TaxID=2837507 RepID=UPI0039A5E792